MVSNNSTHVGGKEVRRKQAVCFTGHRVIGNADLSLIERRLDETIAELIEQGVFVYFSGAALGFDQKAARAVLKAREHNSAVNLIMALPCSDQESRWREGEKQAYRQLLDVADEIVYVSDKPYFDGCMRERNLFLVQHSGICVAYMRRGRSGTAQAVRFAREQGLTVINLAE